MAAIWADMRSRRFLTRFVTDALAAGGLFAGALGLIDVLFLDAFKQWGVPGALAIVAASVSWGLFRAWPRPIEHHYNAPNTIIRVLRGDLLEESGHIVVGGCDTFDTATPDVISPRSLQGQALERLWDGDVHRLDRDLEAALEHEPSVGSVAKAGKSARYAIVTAAMGISP